MTLTPEDTIRAKIARDIWRCGSITLDRVAQEMGITERRNVSEDAGTPWPKLQTAEESHD